MSKLVCWLRLHWLFDHAVTYNALRDVWVCKSCKRAVKEW